MENYKIYRCAAPKCTRIFTSRKEIRRHIKEFHKVSEQIGVYIVGSALYMKKNEKMLAKNGNQVDAE